MILLTGANGQLGRENPPRADHEAAALPQGELDVNGVAYSNVDGCETETAYVTNVLEPHNLVKACQGQGCELMHLSSTN